MKKILAATVLMISAGAACAADMQAVPYTPYRQTPYVAPIFNWTGFYLGAMGGYGWSDEVRASIGGLAVSTSSSDLKGGFAGGAPSATIGKWGVG
jgi:outer membrane immunogenic protein